MPRKTIDQKIDALARMTERGFEDVRKEMATRADLKEVATKTEFQELRREMATKTELRETEEHLLDAIRGIEVRRRDFDALAGVVEDLDRRLSALEKKR